VKPFFHIPPPLLRRRGGTKGGEVENNMRIFAVTTKGYDSQDLYPKAYYLKIRLLANNYRHAVIKANRNMKYRNDKEVKAGGNLIFNPIPLPDQEHKTEKGQEKKR
jgi:hypothetical protein